MDTPIISHLFQAVLNESGNESFSNFLKVLEAKPSEGRLVIILDALPGFSLEKFQEVERDLLLRLHQKTRTFEDIRFLVTQEKGSGEAQNETSIQSIIAIVSGKGGVGKSTLSALIAFYFQGLGRKVGLLDADIYGPSIPLLLNLSKKHEIFEKQIKPHRCEGVKVCSFGNLIDRQDPLIWRGPMVQKAISQLYEGTSWGHLDYLIIDAPPGTGDAHLALAQKIPLKGIILVSTPENIALEDTIKAANLYKKLGVPLLGVVENMAHVNCASCGGTVDLFPRGGVEAWARSEKIPYLGSIPILTKLREHIANGTGPEGFLAAKEKVGDILASLSF